MDLTPGGPRGAMARGLAISAAGDLAAAVASPPFTISPYKESLGNPELAAKCGLDFALVLDSSGSIGSTGIANLKSAANTFVDSLVDTGSSVSVVSFSTASPGTGTGTAPAPVNLAPTALTGANLTTIKNSYRNLRSNGSTNWQDGLAKSQDRFAFPAPGPGSTPGAPDLVVFITDGNPNTVGISPPTPSSQNASPDGSKAAVDPAIDLANAMKTSGVHMFGIAVGGNITLNPIRAITNQEELLANGSNFTTAGYTTTQDYAALAETLKKIAVELCAPSFTVTKLAQKPGSAEYTPADGWSFNTTVTISDAAGKWVTPDKDDPILKDVPSTKTQVTTGSGAANFQWEPAGQFDSRVVISETQKPGFERVSTLTCSIRNVLAGTSRSFDVEVDNSGNWNVGVIGPREIGTCTAKNSLNFAKLTVVKDAVPNDPQDFDFTAAIDNAVATPDSRFPASFKLDDDADGTLSNQQSWDKLSPGTYVITEGSLPAGWTLEDIVLTA